MLPTYSPPRKEKDEVFVLPRRASLMDTIPTMPSASWASRRACGMPALLTIAITAAVFVFYSLGPAAAMRTSASLMAGPVDSNYQPGPTNATLGFGAILLLSLAGRTDRQDALSLITSMSGISISKTIFAVTGKDISPKARPYGNANIGGQPISDGYLGSWRTHMDALRYVVDNRIETALLLEDDVDWDVRIKPQMAALSRGLAESSLRNKSSVPVSDAHPYGMDWDIMHLGPSYVHPDEKRPFSGLSSVYQDDDATKDPGCLKNPSVKDLYCWNPLLKRYNVPVAHRVIIPTYDSVGLAALAVTYEGAQRILYQLSWVKLSTTLDWSISGLVQEGKINGWTPLPPLFSQFKVGGDHDSDLDGNKNTFFGDVKSNKEGYSLGLEFSARAALQAAFEPKSDRWSVGYWHERGAVKPVKGSQRLKKD